MPSFFSVVMTLVRRELLVELRTKEVITTTTVFALLVTVLAALSFHTSAVTSAYLAPGALWLALTFASVFGVARFWQREREEDSLAALVLAPIPRSALFAAKSLVAAIFLFAVAVVDVPTVALLFHIDLLAVLLPLSIVMVLALTGVSLTGTLFGVMTVRTNARDLVLATVLLPLLAPVLVTAVSATREIFSAEVAGQPFPFDELRDYVLLLSVFDLGALGLGAGLFALVVEE